MGDGQKGGKSAGRGDGIESSDAADGAVAGRPEEDGLSVGSPAEGVGSGGVEGQPLGGIAGDGHDVDVATAFVLGRERDLRAVGREVGVGLDAGIGGDSTGVRGFEVPEEEVAFTGEDDEIPVDVGFRERAPLHDLIFGGDERKGGEQKDHAAGGFTP